MKKLFVTITYISLLLNTQAQEPFIRNLDFSLVFGYEDISLKPFSPNNNLDFLNYLSTDFQGLTTIELGAKFDFFKNMHADINIIMRNDFNPNNYDISVHYLINESFGVGVGSSLRSDYVSDFDKYYRTRFYNYFLADKNFRAFELFDMALYISPTYRPKYNEKTKIEIKFDIGISSYFREKTKFNLKKQLSNEKTLYEYKTKLVYQPYINPGIDFRHKVFELRDASVGILLNSNFILRKRSIIYDLSYAQWTADNATTEKISPPKHTYFLFKFSIGTFIAW